MNQKTNSLAVTAFVVSLVSIVLPFLPIIPPLLGIIFGSAALKQIKKNKDEGRGLAIAGIIMGAVSIFITLVFGLLILFVVMAAVNTVDYVIPEVMSNSCYAGNGFSCQSATVNNGLLTVTLQNTEPVAMNDLSLSVLGTCSGQARIGTLEPGEERTVILPCNQPTLQTQFHITSGELVKTSGTISIR